MLTFLFLVSLTATTVLLLAIAAEEVARVTRALFSQANDEIRLGGAAASAAVRESHTIASHEAGELHQFPQRTRLAPRAEQRPQLDHAPDQAA
jgi:hypothetical protein